MLAPFRLQTLELRHVLAEKSKVSDLVRILFLGWSVWGGREVAWQILDSDCSNRFYPVLVSQWLASLRRSANCREFNCTQGLVDAL